MNDYCCGYCCRIRICHLKIFHLLVKLRENRSRVRAVNTYLCISMCRVFTSYSNASPPDLHLYLDLCSMSNSDWGPRTPEFLYQEFYIWIEGLSKMNSEWAKDNIYWCFQCCASAEILWPQTRLGGRPVVCSPWSATDGWLVLHRLSSLRVCAQDSGSWERGSDWFHHMHIPVVG